MPSRRDFLTARSLRDGLGGDESVHDVDIAVPLAQNTIRLAKIAMAADFEVILNAGPGTCLAAASAALDLVDRLEDQLSIYRDHSELSRLNVRASVEPAPVELRLFHLLCESIDYARETEGAFDPTAGRLVALWRQCRRGRRAPSAAEIQQARWRIGWTDVELDRDRLTVHFRRPGIELTLNAIGKGYALDRAGELLDGSLDRESDVSVPGASTATAGDRRAKSAGRDTSGDSTSAGDRPGWMMHGGHSSLLARGSLAGHLGWPISLMHPLVPSRRLGTIWLRDRGMSTSGSGVQFFRAGGKRYGHLIDPRTGWPAEEMLAVIVLAPTAAQAEALSTAFFVLGVEKARAYCHNHTRVSALLVPAPRIGLRLEPVNCGIPETDLLLDPNP